MINAWSFEESSPGQISFTNSTEYSYSGGGARSVAPPCSELTKSPGLPEVGQSDLDTLEMNTSEQDKREMVKPELETLGKDLPFVCVLPDCGQRFAVKRVSC